MAKTTEGLHFEFYLIVTNLVGASLVVQLVKNPPATQETWVRFLGWEDSLDEGMATHSSILAWRIPWAEESGGLQSIGRKMLDTTKHSRAHSNLS